MNLRTETYAPISDALAPSHEVGSIVSMTMQDGPSTAEGEYRRFSSCETTKHMPAFAWVLLLLPGVLSDLADTSRTEID